MVEEWFRPELQASLRVLVARLKGNWEQLRLRFGRCYNDPAYYLGGAP
ncbi:MAG: hypothetical protein KAJ97_09275 [Acidobacteria bacterium]|nr:hypothetical protein [Acidobacteriota bacterium]